MGRFVRVVLLVFLAIVLVPSGSAQSTPLPKPPFTECPAIGLDTSCGLLIVATDYGTFVVDDPTQGPYESRAGWRHLQRSRLQYRQPDA
jgi:hypothetical protein